MSGRGMAGMITTFTKRNMGLEQQTTLKGKTCESEMIGFRRCLSRIKVILLKKKSQAHIITNDIF